MGNFFDKAITQVEGKINEINFQEINKTLYDQTKVAVIASKEFANDISRDIKVNNLIKFFLRIQMS